MENAIVTERALQHPFLPFVGVLDRVDAVAGTVSIIDFKTSTPKPEHRDQLEAYAVLWWRATGQFASRLIVQYLESTSEWGITTDEIEESRALADIDLRHAAAVTGQPPGPAIPGTYCGWCAVRARCDEGWGVP